MNTCARAAAAAILLAFAGTTSAATYSSGVVGLDLAPFDDLYDGTLASMAASAIEIADIGAVETLTVMVALDHSWPGDLVLRLVGPDGTTIDLMNRPGLDTPNDDGDGCCGESDDLNANAPLTFDDLAPIPVEAYEALLGTYYAPDDPLASYAGSGITGTWTLYIGDAASGDTGALDSWAMNVAVVVPLPAGIWLMLSALLSVGALRRR